jgi:hypothetical protein
MVLLLRSHPPCVSPRFDCAAAWLQLRLAIERGRADRSRALPVEVRQSGGGVRSSSGRSRHARSSHEIGRIWPLDSGGVARPRELEVASGVPVPTPPWRASSRAALSRTVGVSLAAVWGVAGLTGGIGRRRSECYDLTALTTRVLAGQPVWFRVACVLPGRPAHPAKSRSPSRPTGRAVLTCELRGSTWESTGSR